MSATNQIPNPESNDDTYRPQFLSQLPHMPIVFDNDPEKRARDSAERERQRAERLSVDRSGLHVGAVAILIAPSLANPTPCLICAVHEPHDDDALTVNGQIVQFAGLRPRIDVLWLRQKDDAELDAERVARGEMLLKHANRYAAHENAPPLNLPQTWPFEIMRAEKVPHKIDAERACALADGNTQNLVNCAFYVAVYGMQAN